MDKDEFRQQYIDKAPSQETPAPPRSKKQSTAEEFTEPPVTVQIKLPKDLQASLKLHSIQTGKSVSELIFDHITSTEMIKKAWISTRKAG